MPNFNNYDAYDATQVSHPLEWQKKEKKSTKDFT